MTSSKKLAHLRNQRTSDSMLRRAHPPKHSVYRSLIAKADGGPGMYHSEITAHIVIPINKQAILYKMYALKAKQLHMLARKAITKK